MTLCPQRCSKCNGWMSFNMRYCAGSPIVNWYCPICDANLNESYSITVSDHTILDETNTSMTDTSCEFCKKIWDNLNIYQAQFSHEWEERNAIVMQGYEPYLYVPCEDDPFYSDIVMQIDYCPKCGRKLIKDSEGETNV